MNGLSYGECLGKGNTISYRALQQRYTVIRHVCPDRTANHSPRHDTGKQKHRNKVFFVLPRLLYMLMVVRLA